MLAVTGGPNSKARIADLLAGTRSRPWQATLCVSALRLEGGVGGVQCGASMKLTLRFRGASSFGPARLRFLDCSSARAHAQGQIHMALYQSSSHLRQFTHAEFDKEFEPSATVAWSGIYRCQGCGREVVHTNGKPLPPQNHHQHSSSQGRIRWKLVVTDSPEPS